MNAAINYFSYSLYGKHENIQAQKHTWHMDYKLETKRDLTADALPRTVLLETN